MKRHTERPLSKLALITDGKRILALAEDPNKMIAPPKTAKKPGTATTTTVASKLASKSET